MSKSFKCEVCKGASETLHMRDLDGKWVCAHCIPEAELNACEGLRERLGLKRARGGSSSSAVASSRRKAA